MGGCVGKDQPPRNQASARVQFLSPDTKPDREIKVILVGDVNVGKTSLLVRFADGEYRESVASIGSEFKAKVIKYQGKVYKLILWDTAGQERFRTISSSLYNETEAFIMAYSITDKESLANIKKQWLVEVDHYAKAGTVRVLVGLKRDLAEARQVSESLARETADEVGLFDCFELSAKTDSDEEIAVPFLRLIALLAEE